MAYSSASSTSTNPRVTPTATEHLHDLVIIPTARMGAPAGASSSSSSGKGVERCG